MPRFSFSEDPVESLHQLEPFIDSRIREFNAIDKGRKGLFGNGLMKSLSLNERGSDERVQHVFNFFRALQHGDAVAIAKIDEAEHNRSRKLIESKSLTLAEYKTLSPANEGTNSAGGYTVPIEFAADLSRNLGEYGYARRYARVVQMSRQKWELAGLLTKPSVSVVAEGAQITASKPTLDQLILTAKKIAAIYPITNELLEDANIDTYAVILDIFTEQFQIAEDQSWLQNSNTNWNGLLWYGAGAITSGVAANGAYAVSRSNNSAGGKTGFPQIGDAASSTADDWANLLYMQQVMPFSLYQDGCYFIDQYVAAAMFSQRGTQGNFIQAYDSLFETKEIGGKLKLYFSGIELCIIPGGIMLNANTTPYDSSAHVSTPYTILVNPKRSYCMMGLRGGFYVEAFREGTADGKSAAEYDLQLLRMKERVSFGCGRPDTMIVLRTDAS